jgi:hypothetical protein
VNQKQTAQDQRQDAPEARPAMPVCHALLNRPDADTKRNHKDRQQVYDQIEFFDAEAPGRSICTFCLSA